MTNKISKWVRQSDNHKKVSDIKEFVPNTYIDKSMERKMDASHKVLLRFVQQVCRELRGALYTRRDQESYWIHTNDNPYVMGWVGRSVDYLSTLVSDEYLYAVVTRTISNWKYGDYSWQHYAKMSTKEDTSLKNARKFLRPMTPHDMAYVNNEKITNCVQKSMYTESEKLQRKYNTLFNENNYANQHIRRIEDGKADKGVVKFIRIMYEKYPELLQDDPDYVKELEEFFLQETAYKLAFKKQFKLYHVRVYNDAFNKQAFDVTFIGNVEGGKVPQSIPIQDQGLSPKYTFNEETLPEALMGKVSVLTMLEENGYVDEVGYKIDTTMFYVFTERDFHISSDTTR